MRISVILPVLNEEWTIGASLQALLALAIWLDEESGPGKENKVIAKLPAGAKVVAK